MQESFLFDDPRQLEFCHLFQYEKQTIFSVNFVSLMSLFFIVSVTTGSVFCNEIVLPNIPVVGDITRQRLHFCRNPGPF